MHVMRYIYLLVYSTYFSLYTIVIFTPYLYMTVTYFAFFCLRARLLTCSQNFPESLSKQLRVATIQKDPKNMVIHIELIKTIPQPCDTRLIFERMRGKVFLRFFLLVS